MPYRLPCLIWFIALYCISIAKAQNITDDFWEQDTTIIGGQVSDISIAKDHRTILALAGGRVYRSNDYGNNWHKVELPSKVTAICALSSNHFIVATEDSIYHSLDKGTIWIALQFPIELGILKSNSSQLKAVEVQKILSIDSIHFLVFVQLSYGPIGGSIDSFRVSVYSTQNFGKSWDSATKLPVTTTDATFLQKYGITILWGFNFGRKDSKGGIIMQSADSGRTWRTLTDSLPSYIDNVIMPEIGVYLITLQSKGLYKSIDSGRTWLPTLSPVATLSGLALHKNMLLAGSREHLYMSLDTGRTWMQYDSTPRLSNLHTIKSDQNTVFLGATTGLFRDTLFPSSFTSIGDRFIPGSINDVEILSPSMMLASYWGGSSISTDRGTTWRKTNLAHYRSRAIGFSSKGTLFVATEEYVDNERSFLPRTRRSMDNGITWEEAHELYDSTLYPIHALCFLPVGDTIFAGALFGGVQRSTDDGRTWIASDGFFVSVEALCRTRAGTLLAGYERAISRSTDGGNVFKPAAIKLTALTFITDIVQNPKT
ncbi:MAG: hypothetical protein LC116_05590, partial [Bacteroidetes bacterium]|nr:hypothetical protein [Bacteroidota bacterium]